MKSKSARREDERVQKLRDKAAIAIRMTRRLSVKCKRAFSEMNELLLASQINDVLHEIDPKILNQVIEKKPEQFLRLAAIINSQAAEKTRREKLEWEFQKYRDHVEEQKRKIQEAARAGEKRGLSPAILARIEEAANLL